MKEILLTVYCFAVAVVVKSQQTDMADTTKPKIVYKALYPEFLGNSQVLSFINYDRTVKKGKRGISMRAGAGIFSFSNASFFLFPPWNFRDGSFQFGRPYTFTIPFEITFMHGRKWNIETGMGITTELLVANKNWWGSDFWLCYRIGLRYQPLTQGFFFRTGLTPMWRFMGYKNEFLFYDVTKGKNFGIVFFPSISMGFSF
ncbi:MAG: hypothetical protein HY063_07515 [Bacteroidetes bacterium]|nr:hypothetical protein [Bacteroidota bacterium]